MSEELKILRSAGFLPRQGSKAQGLGWQEEKPLSYGFDSYNQGLWEEVMPTIRAGGGGGSIPEGVVCKEQK